MTRKSTQSNATIAGIPRLCTSRGNNNRRLDDRSVPKTPLPEIITIFHSTLPENIDSIRSSGVTLVKYDVESVLQRINTSSVPEVKKQSARRRALEAFDRNPSGYVCCSGNKEYSIQNGRAVLEALHYLNGTDWRGPVACFKIILPIRLLEILTPKEYQYLILRFEELWTDGYFKRMAWKVRVKHWDFANPIQTYDHIVLTHVPPEFIKEVEVLEQSRD